MNRLKNWRLAVILLVALGVVAGNAYSLKSGARPFTHTNSEFRVNHYIGDSSWVENAPLILSNHFKSVRLLDVKNVLTVPKGTVGAKVEGFGVQDEIVRIFNHASADYSHSPLDYREVYFDPQTKQHKVITRANLLKYRYWLPSGQGYMNVHCAPLVEHNCTLGLYWNKNKTHRGQDVTFVAVRVHNNFFALIEQNLFNDLTKGAPRA